MKTVHYLGHIFNFSYGDDVCFKVLDNYVRETYGKQIRLTPKRASGPFSNQVRFEGYNFYLLGGGTCLSQCGRRYADLLLHRAAKLNKPYGVFGAGVYFEERKHRKVKHHATSETEKITQVYTQKAKFLAVRDTQSRDHLISLSPDAAVETLYDPGLVIQSPKIPIDKAKPIIGINLAKESMGCLGTIIYNRQKVIDEVLSFIKKYNKKYDFIFLSLNPSDNSFFPLMKQYNVRCYPYRNVAYTTGIIQNCDFFIGVRVHADVTCAAFQIPFLSITYTHPNKYFLDHIKHEHFITANNLGQKKKYSLVNSFETVVEQQDSIRQHLHEQVQLARKSYYEKAAKLCNLILN